MTITRRYARTRRAFISAARDAGTKLTPIRVLVAIADRGGTATSAELYRDIDTDESLIREGLGVLYRMGLATGEGVDGGPRRSSVLTRVSLTETGRVLAVDVIKQAGGRPHKDLTDNQSTTEG